MALITAQEANTLSSEIDRIVEVSLEDVDRQIRRQATSGLNKINYYTGHINELAAQRVLTMVSAAGYSVSQGDYNKRDYTISWE